MTPRTLQLYLQKEAMRPLFGALGILLGIVWLTQSLRFLDLMINKGLGVGVFLQLTILLVPFLLMFILPLAVVAGVCVVLKRINDDSELAPIFSAGLSGKAVAKPLIWIAFLGVLAGYGVSLWLMPLGQTAFKELQHKLRNSDGHLFLETGTFNQLGDGLMVFLKQRTSPYQMEGILVHDTRNPARPVTWMAKRGEVRQTAQGTPELLLEEGVRQDVSERQVSMLQFKSHSLEIARAVSLPGPRSRAPEEFSIFELWEMSTPKGPISAKQAREYQAEFHKRLLWPITPLPLVLIAAGLLLRPRSRRTGVLKPMLATVALTVAYQSLLITLHSLALDGQTALLYGQWLLPFIFGSLGCWWLRERKTLYS